MGNKKLAIIPARGGSKRIERKNVKLFRGIPIIAYSILAALKSGCFDEVMVSTDDEEIAETAREYGASVPFMRSARTSDDYATTADVISEVLEEYRKSGREFDALACIYATAPFVTPERLQEGASILDSGRGQAAFTCVEYSYPIQRSLKIGSAGRIAMKYPEYANARSQDLEKSYHDAGQFYFSTIKQFESSGSLWGPDTMPIILPELEVQDLDTLTDWRLAEIKYELLAMPGRFETSDYIFIPYPEMEEELSAKMLMERNAEEVRKWMVNRSPISEADHRGFVRTLAINRDKQYYAVLDRDGNAIGSVNLERVEPSVMERGIWISADARGMGHASRMLRQLYSYIATNCNINRVVTKVRSDNRASLALENTLGAKETGRDEYVYFLTDIVKI